MPQPATSSAGMTKQLSALIDVESSLGPAARTATASGTGVDLSGYESATVVVQAGAWTDGVHAYKVYESTDDEEYTEASAAHVVGTLATVSGAASDDQVSVAAYVGNCQYIKVVQTISGSPGTGLVSSAVVVKGHARYTDV